VLNDATKAISGKYISSEQDVIITEYNTDRHDGDYSVFITKDSEMTELKEGVDYEVRYSGGEDEWSEYRYVIYAKNFTADARYTVSIHSVDQAGNINISTSDKKKAELTFFIDKTKPLCIPINITENSAYKGEKHTVHLAVSDNLMLKDISVYIDGESVRAHQINDECVFNIPNSKHSQDIKVVLTDMANNQIEYNYKNILVTTNVIRIVAHKTWFKFACGGAALLLSAGAFVLGKRRKTKRFL
jgi:ribosomal protein S8E